tara:strand:+ start:417 stop:611 length:195 start_codon:yes stop_codon:yes gene_type:complete
MAVTVFDFEANQWYVQYANGEYDACHNRATAEKLARDANDARVELVGVTRDALARHLATLEVAV